MVLNCSMAMDNDARNMSRSIRKLLFWMWTLWTGGPQICGTLFRRRFELYGKHKKLHLKVKTFYFYSLAKAMVFTVKG